MKLQNPDGSEWEPKKALICSDHFLGDIHREERNHPDYKPSIFPTSHVRPSTEIDLQRHERARKRSHRDAPGAGPPTRIAKTVPYEALEVPEETEVSSFYFGFICSDICDFTTFCITSSGKFMPKFQVWHVWLGYHVIATHNNVQMPILWQNF